jgi:hypothetical protein
MALVFVEPHPFARTAKAWATPPDVPADYCTTSVNPVEDLVEPLVAVTTTL